MAKRIVPVVLLSWVKLHVVVVRATAAMTIFVLIGIDFALLKIRAMSPDAHLRKNPMQPVLHIRYLFCRLNKQLHVLHFITIFET